MIRVGVVGYHNMLPLASDLESHVPGAVVERGRPSVLADRLAAGDLDVGMVPVAALAAHPGWSVVPNLGIAGRGAVDSVLLLSRTPLADTTRLVLDPASRTSNVLARLWLTHTLGREVAVEEGESDLAARLARGAAVAIGDDALFHTETAAVTVDLGAAWTEWTGLPFVFAVWAGPGADVPGLAAGLEACLAANLERLDALAAAAEPDPARAARVAAYLRESICYRLGEREERGLREFLRLGHAAGFFPAIPEVVCHADPV